MQQKFVFITPLLTECHRIAGTVYNEDDPYKRPIILDQDNTSVLYEQIEDAPLKNRLFKHPYFSKKGGKSESLPFLLQNRDNIVSTHQLFVNLTPEVLKHAKEHILIIDEMLSVYEIYSQFSIEEVQQMFKNEWLTLKEDSITLIFNRKKYGEITEENLDPTLNTYYETFATLCDLGQLMLIDNKVVIWELAVDTLKAFKEIWIATYMFEDNLMATYLNAHNIEYEIIKFGKKPSEIKHLITIYEDTPRSKLNEIGNKDSALSATSHKRTEIKDELSSNLDNFIRNKIKAKKADILWTTFKESKNRIQRNNIHNYTNQWLAYNTKATNSYGDRHTVAYLINLYPNPELVKASSYRGHSVKEDIYAISEMVQFIWRSAIRNNEPINLYIPSSRMRNFLIKWLNDEYEIN